MAGAVAADHVSDFERDTARLFDMIDGVMPEAAWLDPHETLTYLHSTISPHEQRIALPETPMHLDALLADATVVGGPTPPHGDKPLPWPSLTALPAPTVPGLLDEPTRFGLRHRWAPLARELSKAKGQ